jgi:hypothetical protein
MALTVTIKDELPFGKVTNQIEFVVQNETMTVRELIRERVHQEVSLYNLSLPSMFKGLVQHLKKERTLNGQKHRKPRKLDWEEQAEIAIEAFESNGFFILVNDRQVEKLDETITIGVDTEINFVKLTPLVGG